MISPENNLILTFRARDYAKNGRHCREFQEVRRLLPRESTLHAWFRDSGATWFEHRCKSGLNLTDADVVLDSSETQVSTSFLSKFYNDSRGFELLGVGAFMGFLRVNNRWHIPPGNAVVEFAASLRRIAENLRALRINRRLKNAERLGLIECTVFEGLWHDRNLRQEFLNMLDSFECPDDVDESLRSSLSGGAYSIAIQLFDEIDREVFGVVTPHLPSIFEMIVDFWQEYGMEWLVAREALCEFLPE